MPFSTAYNLSYIHVIIYHNIKEKETKSSCFIHNLFFSLLISLVLPSIKMMTKIKMYKYRQQASSRCSSGKGYIVSIIIIYLFSLTIDISTNIFLSFFCSFQCDSEGDDDKVSNKNLSLLIHSTFSLHYFLRRSVLTKKRKALRFLFCKLDFFLLFLLLFFVTGIP